MKLTIKYWKIFWNYPWYKGYCLDTFLFGVASHNTTTIKVKKENWESFSTFIKWIISYKYLLDNFNVEKLEENAKDEIKRVVNKIIDENFIKENSHFNWRESYYCSSEKMVAKNLFLVNHICNDFKYFEETFFNIKWNLKRKINKNINFEVIFSNKSSFLDIIEWWRLTLWIISGNIQKANDLKTVIKHFKICLKSEIQKWEEKNKYLTKLQIPSLFINPYIFYLISWFLKNKFVWRWEIKDDPEFNTLFSEFYITCLLNQENKSPFDEPIKNFFNWYNNSEEALNNINSTLSSYFKRPEFKFNFLFLLKDDVIGTQKMLEDFKDLNVEEFIKEQRLSSYSYHFFKVPYIDDGKNNFHKLNFLIKHLTEKHQEKYVCENYIPLVERKDIVEIFAFEFEKLKEQSTLYRIFNDNEDKMDFVLKLVDFLDGVKIKDGKFLKSHIHKIDYVEKQHYEFFKKNDIFDLEEFEEFVLDKVVS